MKYYCIIKSNDDLKPFLENGEYEYKKDKECEEYIQNFIYETVGELGSRNIKSSMIFDREMYFCLSFNDNAKNRDSIIEFSLKTEIPANSIQILDVNTLIKIADEKKYSFNKNLDFEMLKEFSPIIMSAGILACISQGGQPEPESIAKDTIEFSIALIKEINKERY